MRFPAGVIDSPGSIKVTGVTVPPAVIIEPYVLAAKSMLSVGFSEPAGVDEVKLSAGPDPNQQPHPQRPSCLHFWRHREQLHLGQPDGVCGRPDKAPPPREQGRRAKCSRPQVLRPGQSGVRGHNTLDFGPRLVSAAA